MLIWLMDQVSSESNKATILVSSEVFSRAVFRAFPAPEFGCLIIFIFLLVLVAMLSNSLLASIVDPSSTMRISIPSG